MKLHLPRTRRQPARLRSVRNDSDDYAPVIRPPDAVTTFDDRKPVLWTHDEQPLVRRIGF